MEDRADTVSAWLRLLLLAIITCPLSADIRPLVTLDARDYITLFKAPLTLGSCPSRASPRPDGTYNVTHCSVRFGGVAYLIPLGSSKLQVKRVQTAEDVISYGAGGIGVGVGVGGVIGVKVKVKVGVNTQTNRRLLTLTSSYRLQRGVQTLREARPLTPLPDTVPTALYLSETVLGGEEMMVVTMEFESEKKRVEVETTVTLKILFISISAKVRFVKDTFKAAASVKVELISSWRESQERLFVGPGSLDGALKVVEELEKKFEKAPGDLQALDLADPKLHLEYRFNTWATGNSRYNFNQAETASRTDRLVKQTAEVDGVLATLQSYLETANHKPPPTSSQRRRLQTLQDEMQELRQKLTTSLSNYLDLSEQERAKLSDIYGRNRAPFYYRRQMDAIYRPTELS